MPEGKVSLLGWKLSGHLHLHHAAPVHSRPCLGLVSAWLLKACPSMCCGEPFLVPQEKGQTAQQQILGSRSLRLASPHEPAGTRHAMALYVSLATRPVLFLVLVQMARCLPKCLPLHLAHGMGASGNQAGSHPGREAVLLHQGDCVLVSLTGPQQAAKLLKPAGWPGYAAYTVSPATQTLQEPAKSLVVVVSTSTAPAIRPLTKLLFRSRHEPPCSRHSSALLSPGALQVLPLLDTDNLAPPVSTPPEGSPTLSPFKLAARKHLSWATHGYRTLSPGGSPGSASNPPDSHPDSPGAREGRSSDVEVRRRRLFDPLLARLGCFTWPCIMLASAMPSSRPHAGLNLLLSQLQGPSTSGSWKQ